MNKIKVAIAVCAIGSFVGANAYAINIMGENDFGQESNQVYHEIGSDTKYASNGYGPIGSYNKHKSSNREKSSNNYWRSSFSVPKTGPANGKGTVVFDPNNLHWAAYDPSGNLVSSGRASGGRSFCEDIGRGCKTPVGHFKVSHKGPAECYSKTYPIGEGGAYMPHCMFFQGGYAIHGSYHVPNYNASHGCIRVQPEAATWLYNNFVKPGTAVVVKSY